MYKVEDEAGKKPIIKGTVLIIDDNKSCGLLIKEYLELFYDLKNITISNEFVLGDIVKNIPNIKLILMNYKLIKPHNYKVVKEIHKKIPIIVISSDSSNAALNKIDDWGLDDILLKPISANELVSKVSRFL